MSLEDQRLLGRVQCGGDLVSELPKERAVALGTLRKFEYLVNRINVAVYVAVNDYFYAQGRRNARRFCLDSFCFILFVFPSPSPHAHRLA